MGHPTLSARPPRAPAGRSADRNDGLGQLEGERRAGAKLRQMRALVRGRVCPKARPLTLELPKPVVPVGDRPLLAHVRPLAERVG